ncbi:hypothetical protein MKW98_032223 [Papaver atlanticum]|uniref:Uncharacterized protein n=1 Tax=Papaver atlanticum TaxID=357466 RepID=A0AAD4XDA0_9MAGN|nr:hypothetical protein MKW98_032223 [Papaver atlanticum]
MDNISTLEESRAPIIVQRKQIAPSSETPVTVIAFSLAHLYSLDSRHMKKNPVCVAVIEYAIHYKTEFVHEQSTYINPLCISDFPTLMLYCLQLLSAEWDLAYQVVNVLMCNATARVSCVPSV